jgi:hypothetical protein
MSDSERSIYEKRVKCWEKLNAIQKRIERTEDEYITVSLAEGKTHENALNRLGIYRKEYNDLYEQCKNILTK